MINRNEQISFKDILIRGRYPDTFKLEPNLRFCFSYRQCFDLEGETGGVVVRGIGTAVKLNRYKKVETVVSRNR